MDLGQSRRESPVAESGVNRLSPLRLTVSRSGGADFTTISAAVQTARAGTVIVVTDDAVYTETLTLATSNLTVLAERQATISACQAKRAVLHTPLSFATVMTCYWRGSASKQGLTATPSSCTVRSATSRCAISKSCLRHRPPLNRPFTWLDTLGQLTRGP